MKRITKLEQIELPFKSKDELIEILRQLPIEELDRFHIWRHENNLGKEVSDIAVECYSQIF
tara:strand:- start:594 stop:776 length:183 start_codon:yes stop_codon:yes gene_type:complete